MRKWAWAPSECSALRAHCRKSSRAGCRSGLVRRRPSSSAAMSLMLPGEDRWPLYMSMILDTIGGQLPELQWRAWAFDGHRMLAVALVARALDNGHHTEQQALGSA